MKESLEQPINEDEKNEAVKTLPNRKSAGLGGITLQFYKRYKNDLDTLESVRF